MSLFRFVCLGLCLWLALPACRPQAPPEPPAQEGAEQTLGTVALPTLDDLPPSARTQVTDQYARLQALTRDPAVEAATLGEAYGEMGLVLLTYDFREAAEPALNNAAALLPDDVRWPYYLGYLHRKANELEASALHYERALALQPGDVPTRIHLAEVYRDLGREPDAVALLQEALRLDPKCAAAHFLLGQLADADDPAEAILHYQAVLRLQPAASIVHYPLGLAFRKQGDLERSRTYLEQRGESPVELNDPLLRNLEQKKRGPAVKLLQGGKYMQQRRFREAAALFAAAIAEDSTDATGYLNLGAAYLEMGNPESAARALEQALRLDPANGKAHYNMGVIFEGRGDTEQALEHFLAAIEADPNSTDAHFALTRIYRRSGRCEEALPHFEAFLAASPGHVEARINAAICRVKLGDYAGARALLEAGYASFPDQPGLQDALIRVLAASPDDRVRDGRRALELAEPLAAALPRPETLESLAMAYAELGRFPEAVERQKEAIRIAEQQGQSPMLDPLKANLRRYEQEQPCRTPWPPFVLGQ